MAGFCPWDVLPQEREDWVLVHPLMPVGGLEQSLLPGGVMGQHTDAGSLLLYWGAGIGKDRGHNQDPPSPHLPRVVEKSATHKLGDF